MASARSPDTQALLTQLFISSIVSGLRCVKVAAGFLRALSRLCVWAVTRGKILSARTIHRKPLTILLCWLQLRCGFFPRARLLLSGAPFARSRFGFWLFRRGRLPLSRCFAFLTQLLLVQIPSKLLISKTAAKASSSNCQCSCDLNWPAARCHVPRTFV